MKPNKIILVRHGESEGNIDKTIYERKPDYTLELTETGKTQALIVGGKLRQCIPQNETVMFYISPLWRSRQTYQQIRKSFEFSPIMEYPQLREQEWGGNLRDPAKENIDTTEAARDAYGSFYYRLPNGESCADVYDRMSDFFGILHRDFNKDFSPHNVIIVCHGMSMRLFLMRWFHYSVEKFEKMANPKNCEFWIMQKNVNDKYDLISQPREHNDWTHPYQYDWEKMK